ncbi:Protein of unknown function [Micromonospora lupini str. Lupac 08]|uniref:Uncharacterized protein n=1 Tax=Micromonospora lupini str. Lupac 08 TaxID=1150864 RepID=I0L6G9_9ACTN|nr:Protein of unknown function [Micromonospora lupini str. Lupac 08]
MVARRWDARSEEEHLVLRRWRLLPWPKAHVRRIPLAAILDIGSFTAADQAKRHAQLTVQVTSASGLTEVIPVRFTREHPGRPDPVPDGVGGHGPDGNSRQPSW